jgi:hypothetical protein
MAVNGATIIQRVGTRLVITPPGCDSIPPFPNNECAGRELDTSFAKQASCRSGRGGRRGPRQMFWLPIRTRGTHIQDGGEVPTRAQER